MKREDVLLIRLLGSVAVWRGGREVYVGPARQREVLAVLALHAGQVVSVAEVAAAVWGDRQPRSVENLVHTYVGRLRAALGGGGVDGSELLRSTRPGYQLAVPLRGVDVYRFEDSVRRARAAVHRSDLRAGVTQYHTALAMWAGTALAEATGPVAEAERARLTEMRHEVTEELMAAQLELGEVRGLVPELRRMIIREPLRERLWALLLLVLGRTSRTAEALSVYHEARVTLSDRLGVEPGDELQRLYRSLLRGEPMLTLTGPAARTGTEDR